MSDGGRRVVRTRVNDVPTGPDADPGFNTGIERDFQQETPMNQHPRPLRAAVLLMYVGAALSALNALVSLTLRDHIRAGIAEHARTSPRDRLTPVEIDQAASTTVVVLVVTAVVAAVIWLAMGWLNARGRWWARITATVLALFCLLQTWSFLTRGHPTMLAAAVAILILAVALAAAALLWHPDNRGHFGADDRRSCEPDALL